MLKLPGVLAPDALAALRRQLDAAQLVDGTVSGKATLKKNLVSAQGNPGLEQPTQTVIQALSLQPDFKAYAVPKQVTVVFNRYDAGMFYRTHMDAALMGGLRRQPLRADLSFTLFLSEPGDYGGGELVLESPFGEVSLKEPAGTVVVYPSSMLHRVETVSQGARVAAIGWVHSMFRDQAQRQLLFDLYELRRDLVGAFPDSPYQERVDRIQENLVRLWAEV